MRNFFASLLIFLVFLVPAPLLSGCAFTDRLEEIGAGYGEMDERIYSIPLNAAARRLMSALGDGGTDAAALIAGADKASCARLAEMMDGMTSYRLREEERSSGVIVCLAHAVLPSGGVRMRLLYDTEKDIFRSVEAAADDVFGSKGFCFSPECDLSGIYFPEADDSLSVPILPTFDGQNSPYEKWDYDAYHECAAGYLQAVERYLSSGDSDGMRALFSIQSQNSVTDGAISDLISAFGDGWSSWRTDGSLVTSSGAVCDEYDESGRRTESLESDMKEHIRAVFGIEGSSVKTVTHSLWPRNDPEPYRIGQEGIRIELTDGTSVTVGRGV